jgi:hypothetical protein
MTKNFLDQAVFEDLLRSIGRADGGVYSDTDTIFGDMSRLVVAWIARTPPAELASLYNELGWKGNGNARAIHFAAKRWMQEHRPMSQQSAPA